MDKEKSGFEDENDKLQPLLRSRKDEIEREVDEKDLPPMWRKEEGPGL
jgi:hypothetical protein